MANVHPIDETTKSMAEIVVAERTKSLLLRAWIVAGLFFMALPGTLLGFANLLAISAHHGLSSLPAAWLQGHGHAQLFGWIGSFILGIGFYSQPLRGKSAIAPQLSCLVLWASGVSMRWLAGICSWHWRILLVLSAAFEMITVLLFLAAASRHKPPARSQSERAKPPIDLWMVSVLVGTAGLTSTILFNLVECVKLAIAGTNLAFPHAVDQKFLVLAAWGFVVPVVWGFSARWLPTFLAIPRPNNTLFATTLVLDLLGTAFGASGFALAAALLLFAATITVVQSLRLAQKPDGQAKVQGIHPSFPAFIRLAYLWLIIAGAMGVWAVVDDRHGGIWGASRHALTVGFAATMVFAIGPRILPHFSGIYAIFSKRLMFLALLLVQAGCTLRVCSEPLAYEGVSSLAWKTLPISGVLELGAVLVFAANLALTMIAGKSAFAHRTSIGQSLPAA